MTHTQDIFLSIFCLISEQKKRNNATIPPISLYGLFKFCRKKMFRIRETIKIPTQPHPPTPTDKKIIEHQFNRQSQNHHGLTYKAE